MSKKFAKYNRSLYLGEYIENWNKQGENDKFPVHLELALTLRVVSLSHMEIVWSAISMFSNDLQFLFFQMIQNKNKRVTLQTFCL